MADRPREWIDIDKTWMQNYLQERDLASSYDLDDELLGAQMSWILSEDQWASLRDAWENRQRTEEVGDAADRAGATTELLAATEERLESAGAGTPEIEVGGSVVTQKNDEPAKELHIPVTEPVKQIDVQQRMSELAQTALSDWGAFKVLFRGCIDSADVGAWEMLADSPVALLKQAEKLIWIQDVKAEAKKQQLEREFEEEVTRAQNSIAGYYIYCRKHSIAPSLEHLLDFIPVMRTGYSPGSVREAWRREAASQ